MLLDELDSEVWLDTELIVLND
ncbi:hypothetical protein CCP1ISM_20060 [Azospirillaceae bacterium]